MVPSYEQAHRALLRRCWTAFVVVAGIPIIGLQLLIMFGDPGPIVLSAAVALSIAGGGLAASVAGRTTPRPPAVATDVPESSRERFRRGVLDRREDPDPSLRDDYVRLATDHLAQTPFFSIPSTFNAIGTLALIGALGLASQAWLLWILAGLGVIAAVGVPIAARAYLRNRRRALEYLRDAGEGGG